MIEPEKMLAVVYFRCEGHRFASVPLARQTRAIVQILRSFWKALDLDLSRLKEVGETEFRL